MKAMETKQYRIMRSGMGWKLIVTHGLLDTETLRVATKQADLRAYAKEHAKRTGVTPIILT